jgi:hypothetical protein
MAGFLSLLLMLAVFSLPRLYERLRVPAWLTPACGGLLVGCVGLVMPRALGVGRASMMPWPVISPSLWSCLSSSGNWWPPGFPLGQA